MKKIILKDLDKFSEATGAWNQMFVMTKFSGGREQLAFMVYPSLLFNLFVCRGKSSRYYRWLWFELDIYSKEAVVPVHQSKEYSTP